MIDYCHFCGKELDWEKVYVHWTHVKEKTVATCGSCPKEKPEIKEEQLALDI